MKILHLGIIIILGTILGISTHVAFADDINGVQIQNIKIQPSTIKVGDNFNITATLVNNSTDTISVHNDCLSPFSVTFSHATVDVEKPCIYFAISKLIKPGENITVTGPGSNIAYRATDAGVANATITFSYTDENQTNSNTSVNPSNLSKSILFTILPQSTQATPAIPSPLEQFRSGVKANNIICRDDLQLLIENHENFPICVTLNTAFHLSLLDWSYPSNCEYNQNPFTAGVAGLIVIEKNASDQTSGKSYSPRNSTVVIGWNNTVSWINQDDAYSSVTSDLHLFDSGSIKPGGSWQHSFECLGTYTYHSEPHPWMLGVIRVLLHK